MTFFNSIELNLHSFSVNTAEQGARIRIGMTAVAGLSNNSQKTQGFGQQHADGVRICESRHLIDDRDILDSNAMKGPFEGPPFFNQS